MRPLPPLSVAAAALSLLLAGCGGDEARIEPTVADGLAQHADAVTEALEAGDGCLALDRTAELEIATTRAREAGEVSDGVAAEVLTAAQRISEGTTCDPQPVEQDDGGEHEQDPKDDAEKDEKDDRGRGRGRGNGGGDDDDD